MKNGILPRVLAKSVDLILVFLMGAILPRVVGPLLGFGYSLFADGLNYSFYLGKAEKRRKIHFEGQSVGKKIFKLAAFSTIRNTPVTYKESAIRNAPVGVVTFFSIIPVWGWIFSILFGIPLLAMEIYLMNKLENGSRLGDVMADTQVRAGEGF